MPISVAISCVAPSSCATGGKDNLIKLWERLKNGTCHFVKITNKEQEAIRERYKGVPKKAARGQGKGRA